MEALKMMFGKLRPGDKCQTLMILHQYFLNVMSILDLKWLQFQNLKGKKAPAPSVGAHI